MNGWIVNLFIDKSDCDMFDVFIVVKVEIGIFWFLVDEIIGMFILMMFVGYYISLGMVLWMLIELMCYCDVYVVVIDEFDELYGDG